MVSKTSKDVISTFCSQILCSFFALMAAVLVARLLGPKGKGVVSFLILLPMLSATVGGLGIQAANTFFVSAARSAKKDLLANSLVLAAILGTLTSLAIWLILSWLRFGDFQKVAGALIAAAIFLSPLLFVRRYIEGLLIGLREFTVYNILRFGQPVAYLLGIIIFIIFGNFSSYKAFLAWYVSIGLVVVLSLFILLRIGRDPTPFRVNLGLVRRLISYGTTIHIGDVAQFLNYRLDQFVVAFFLGATGLGLYSVAVNVVEVIWYFPVSLATVLFPVAASAGAKEADGLTARMCRMGNFFALGLAIVGFALAGPGLRYVFGPRFLSAALALQLLLPGVVAMGLARIVSSALAARNKQIITAYAGLAAVIITLILDLILIPRFGISGAVVASSIAYIVYASIVIRGLVAHSTCKVSEILKPNFSEIITYSVSLLKALRKSPEIVRSSGQEDQSESLVQS